jgi:catechol 2,3-dioxygenase-like lactoylglutathione lyase family enzyme
MTTAFIYDMLSKKEVSSMEHNFISGFHHVGLKCSNIEKSLTMYKALGMKEVMRWGEGENMIVMLDIGDSGRIEMFANGSDAFSPSGKWIHFALKVTDADAAYRHALSVGFTSHMEPTSMVLATNPSPTPIRIAFVCGPDGEQLEFFTEA